MESGAELEWKAVIFWVFSTFVAVISCAGEVLAADMCTFQQGTTTVVAYCEDGCCDDGCCSSSSSSVDTRLILIIVGVIVGVIIIVLFIIIVVCCLKERKKEKTTDTDATDIELSPKKAFSAPEDPERPKLQRENAIFVVKNVPHAKAAHTRSAPKLHRENAIVLVSGSSRSKAPPHCSQPAEVKDNGVVHHGDTNPHNGRRHSTFHRSSKVRLSDSFLPQVDEMDELEEESQM